MDGTIVHSDEGEEQHLTSTRFSTAAGTLVLPPLWALSTLQLFDDFCSQTFFTVSCIIIPALTDSCSFWKGLTGNDHMQIIHIICFIIFNLTSCPCILLSWSFEWGWRPHPERTVTGSRALWRRGSVVTFRTMKLLVFPAAPCRGRHTQGQSKVEENWKKLQR